MADIEIENSPPLFFAGSDDEQEVEMKDSQEPAAGEEASSSRPGDVQAGLFLPGDSDDEYDSPADHLVPQKRLNVEDHEESDSEVLGIEDVPRASSISSMSSHISVSSDTPPPGPPEPDVKPPPLKKRRVSPIPSNSQGIHFPAYIGEVFIPNAWSNVSGKGYVKINDLIRIERDDDEGPKAASSNNKGKKKVDDKKGKKQQTITAMFKAQPMKRSKKKEDTIVRLVTTRGFGEWHTVACSASLKNYSQSLVGYLRTCLGGLQSF